jgi:hypothetical protein
VRRGSGLVLRLSRLLGDASRFEGEGSRGAPRFGDRSRALALAFLVAAESPRRRAGEAFEAGAVVRALRPGPGIVAGGL